MFRQTEFGIKHAVSKERYKCNFQQGLEGCFGLFLIIHVGIMSEVSPNGTAAFYTEHKSNRPYGVTSASLLSLVWRTPPHTPQISHTTEPPTPQTLLAGLPPPKAEHDEVAQPFGGGG